MKLKSFLECCWIPWPVVLTVVFLGRLGPGAKGADSLPAGPLRFEAASDEFAGASRTVLALLRTRDAAGFAREITASAEDWKSIASTNLPEASEDLKGFAERARSQREEVEAAAKAFLAKADSLRLDFSRGDLHERVITPRFLGSAHFPTVQAEGERIAHAQKLEIVLHPEGGTNQPASGEYRVVLRRLNKFPAGWRCAGGIEWESFPTNVADEQTVREMAILEKAARNRGITGEDDPALLGLGQTLVQFIRGGDVALYTRAALVDSDLVWGQMQRSGEKGPSRQELEKEMQSRTREQTEIARSLIEQDQAAGLDLKDAEILIQKVSVGQVQPAGPASPLDGMRGEQFKMELAVRTDGKSKTGVSLSGDYVLAVNQVERFTNGWKVGDTVRWARVPAGVVEEKFAAAMKVENYVGEHGTLPPGSAVPEIEFTTLDEEKKMKLSDLHGKVVVLDFWATWCGPCQAPMADLQKLRSSHPDWGDRVVIVPLSIDDTLSIVRQHVNQREWTKTFNVWAGDGGWGSAPVKAFRVSGVPTTYIIDAQGQIAAAGHPAALPIADRVDALLKATRE